MPVSYTHLDVYKRQGDTNSSQGAWLKNDVGWWYCNADRSYPVNQWQYINNYWYFFNASGYMVTGWVQWNNVWYYCCDSGETVSYTHLTIIIEYKLIQAEKML